MIEVKEQKNSDSNIWSWIGKISAVVTMLYGATEIYKTFYKPSEYFADCNGHYYKYETATNFFKAVQNQNEYKAALRSEIEINGSTKIQDIDSLVEQIKRNEGSERKNEFQFNFNNIDLYGRSKKNYKIFWEFSIRNNGYKPIEDMILEIPVSGYYKIVLPNNVVQDGDFKDRITIGEIKSSYDAVVKIWSESDYYEYEDFRFSSIEAKSRITHKYGWFPINYPNKPKLNGQDNATQVFFNMILILGVLFVVFFIYQLGYSKGWKNSKLFFSEKLKDNIEN